MLYFFLYAFDFLFVPFRLYRTPKVGYDSLFLHKLDMTLSLLNESYDNLILTGDININVLKVMKDYENP